MSEQTRDRMKGIASPQMEKISERTVDEETPLNSRRLHNHKGLWMERKLRSFERHSNRSTSIQLKTQLVDSMQESKYLQAIQPLQRKKLSLIVEMILFVQDIMIVCAQILPIGTLAAQLPLFRQIPAMCNPR
jgi:hypothetical protein